MQVIRLKQGDTFKLTVTLGYDVAGATLVSALVAQDGTKTPLIVTVDAPATGVILVERHTADLPEGTYQTDVRVTIGSVSFSTDTVVVSIEERVS
jgi:hypothetical protein